MPHSGGKLGVTPFLAIQSSLYLLVLQLVPLTSVHSKNAFSAFCVSSTLFLRTVTKIEVSSAYLVRSLAWQYWVTSTSFKNRLNKYRPLTLPWVVLRLTSFQSQTVLWQTTLCFLSEKKLTYSTSWQRMGLKGPVLVSLLISCAHSVKGFWEIHRKQPDWSALLLPNWPYPKHQCKWYYIWAYADTVWGLSTHCFRSALVYNVCVLLRTCSIELYADDTLIFCW